MLSDLERNVGIGGADRMSESVVDWTDEAIAPASTPPDICALPNDEIAASASRASPAALATARTAAWSFV